MFFDAARIIRATKPKVAILENVKNLTSKKFENEFNTVLKTLEHMGYNNYWKVVRGDQYGVPQIRPRVFVVSIRKDLDSKIFEFPKPYECKRRMYDYLENDVDDRYFLSDRMMAYVLDLDEKQKGTKWEGRANGDYINPIIAHTLSVRGIKGQRAGVSNVICTSTNQPIKVSDYKEKLCGSRKNTDLRNLTERERERVYDLWDLKILKLIKSSISSLQLNYIHSLATQSLLMLPKKYFVCCLIMKEI